MLYTSFAFAQDAAVAEQPSLFSSLAPLILIVVVFYFLLIRPQQKKVKEHQEVVNNLKKGDKIVTAGGIVGAIVKVEQDNIVLAEIAPETRVKIKKDTITEVL